MANAASISLWYPIKGRQQPDALARRLRRSAIPKILRAEVAFGTPAAPGRLGGCGLIAINPPWTLEAELAAILPALAGVFAGSCRVDALTRAG